MRTSAAVRGRGWHGGGHREGTLVAAVSGPAEGAPPRPCTCPCRRPLDQVRMLTLPCVRVCECVRLCLRCAAPRYLCEQVSHHPPVSCFVGEGAGAWHGAAMAMGPGGLTHGVACYGLGHRRPARMPVSGPPTTFSADTDCRIRSLSPRNPCPCTAATRNLSPTCRRAGLLLLRRGGDQDQVLGQGH